MKGIVLVSLKAKETKKLSPEEVQDFLEDVSLNLIRFMVETEIAFSFEELAQKAKLN